VILALVAFAVLAKGFYIMTVQRDYWLEVSATLKYDSIPVKPVRGNILASNGQQLACNIPEYKIHMDFVALKESKADTLWHDSLGNDTKTLNQLCQDLVKSSRKELQKSLRLTSKKVTRKTVDTGVS
jgi:cell division protein FtsI (penicillin-binding protein 3)